MFVLEKCSYHHFPNEVFSWMHFHNVNDNPMPIWHSSLNCVTHWPTPNGSFRNHGSGSRFRSGLRILWVGAQGFRRENGTWSRIDSRSRGFEKGRWLVAMTKMCLCHNLGVFGPFLCKLRHCGWRLNGHDLISHKALIVIKMRIWWINHNSLWNRTLCESSLVILIFTTVIGSDVTVKDL